MLTLADDMLCLRPCICLSSMAVEDEALHFALTPVGGKNHHSHSNQKMKDIRGRSSGMRKPYPNC